jgi:hypothetical protein
MGTREQKIWATRQARYGKSGLKSPPKKRPMMERFFEKVIFEPNCGCWLWEGTWSPDGYGYFHVEGRKMKVAHKFLYEREIAPVPEGMELDHLCKLRCCVNPQHLEAVTHAVNISRGQSGSYNKNKTHCRNGHPYSGDNLRTTASGERVCRTCCRERMREHRARKAAKQ